MSMEMSRRGAFALGVAGAVTAVAQSARRAVIDATSDLRAVANGAAPRLDGRAGAYALQPGSTFAMSSQAGGTRV